MSEWERFDDMMGMMGRVIALAFLGFAFGVIAWGVIIVMLWIQKAALS
jgi:hypothetical protein